MQLEVSDVAFHQRLGRLVEKLDDKQFWQALIDLLRKVVHVDNWVVMIFWPNGTPQLIAEIPARAPHDELFKGYLNSVYLLDPFYQFSLGAISPGVYCLDEVAPDHFRETEYFRRYFSVNVLEDEVQLLAPLPAGGTLSVSLGSERRFNATEIGTLCLYGAWLLPLMCHALSAQTALLPPPVSSSAQSDRRLHFEQALHKRSNASLTQREIEVALMILAGHSTKNMAKLLGVSPATAKVHRRNLYRKLNISSQSTLFLLIMDGESEAS
ncbi:bacterial regulatory s, luxR family protein [Paraburkholderia fungorum]|jgi:DNA-binding CsgD family transcriptional regulator|uniref:Bacterial regulatory s, luxR family protein n=1 Tax=Paraburkholderia fungorum TaxID=134537 RepID=A0AAU8TNW5_9BURK|nr:helix-turn-helix transcriptional regulator [Paraburkholderia fungorum]AJZ64118.1 bacterial regulatory s, luxR family protein [Paraburkholderia fungorum]MBB5541772.1 DNA-binding CsgD family transcriptional regulator [Paraburkholderia fungorum]PNE53923.1 LuxR family transcriptional regulator [Paraburkholderia fungorum]USU21136.1 helix-turn-helix transcriptional regulator [Paraburkholderia fungorum]USU26868.1 helix-turn-helix transcriptional regulator [Paraburkholderia fungorum]